MRILAIDPGGTTGYAFFERDGNPGELGVEELWNRDQLEGQHHDALYDLLDEVNPHTLIYERFNYQRRTLDKGVSLNLDAVEYIGVIKLWHSKHFETVDLVAQVAMKDNPGKNFWTNDKIEKLGLDIPGAPHAMDATRHLLYFLTFTRKEGIWVERLR